MSDEDRARARQGQRVIVALLGAADATRRHLGRVTEPHGLTLQQYNVLRILRGAAPDPLPTMEIAERMLERTPGITRFLDILDARGFVRRERCDDDRRKVHAWITDAGLERLAEMDPDVDAADRALVEGLSAAAVDRLVGALSIVAGNAESARVPNA